jgi:hypothetical protein
MVKTAPNNYDGMVVLVMKVKTKNDPCQVGFFGTGAVLEGDEVVAPARHPKIEK